MNAVFCLRVWSESGRSIGVSGPREDDEEGAWWKRETAMLKLEVELFNHEIRRKDTICSRVVAMSSW